LRLLHLKLETDRLSVDRDKRAYLAWQGGFHEGCIRLYRQAQLLKRGRGLDRAPIKNRAFANGTKDTADAAVGSYFNAISSEEGTVLTVPSTPPAVQGISPLSIRSADDPFGLLRGFKPRLCKESILR